MMVTESLQPSTPSSHGETAPVHRVEVRVGPGMVDARGQALSRLARSHGVPADVRSVGVYLIEGHLSREALDSVGRTLLAEPVTQVACARHAEARGEAPHGGAASAASAASAAVEIHPMDGVMDPAAESVQEAIRALLGVDVCVRTGERLEFAGVDSRAARGFVDRYVANGVIQAVHEGAYWPVALPHGHSYDLVVRHVEITTLSDAALEKLSREGHLFLSLAEMKAIQAEYRRLGREPREIELETLAQTWSEHCVHKTLKSRIAYSEPAGAGEGPSLLEGAERRPGHSVDGATVRIDNLLKSTVAAATNALIGKIDPPAGAGWTRESAPVDWCLSVFVDNAGVIAFDEEHAVCFKVETHNRPSAIEPYGGAATGIGGCIRDVMGTGLAAKPIAATDVFCVAPTSTSDHDVPLGCLHPSRILTQVVAGVRDYGNRMGIPTVNGGVWQDERHIGNPLVFCGVVGVMPRDCVVGRVERGDAIVALGGRTGRDGIHGATFSSAEVEHGHATEFAHAVQIGNAITEKRTLDAILEARDQPDGPLFNGLTDCGAGGFSSAVGEMGKDVGAVVHLERAPTKYAGLSPTEVWISEAQERMVLAVPATKLPRLRAICAAHGCELSELGTFGSDDGTIRLFWHGKEVGALDTHFLHEGIPQLTREAVWDPEYNRRFAPRRVTCEVSGGMLGRLRALLAHPNIASKAWIIRQYDHEVQGNTLIKPLQGPNAGPGDAAVMRPVKESRRGLAIANGLSTGLAADPYLMTLAAIDECVRNLVCVGANPSRIAILDNFCWAKCDDPRNLGGLVRAAEACLDAALAYRTPFISGKDSLSNQFRSDDGTLVQIPPTLLISGFGIVEDIHASCTMDAKRAGSALLAVGITQSGMGGSTRSTFTDGGALDQALPVCDPTRGARTAHGVAALIRDGAVLSAHDCSEGGVLVAAAEMAFAGGLGVSVQLGSVPHEPGASREACAFGETASRYLLEVAPDRVADVERRLRSAGVEAFAVIGAFTADEAFELDGEVIGMVELRRAWEGGSEVRA